VAYLLTLLSVVLVAAGYLLGTRRARTREVALKTTLDERDQKLNLVQHELLRHTAIDPVSGLHNQQHFQEFLEREWRRAARDRQSLSIVMVEVDHFKAFNERQGKRDGDTCLKVVADVLKPLVHRPGDVLARYGGPGKFGIVLGGTDGKGAVVLAERLRLAVDSLKVPNPASTTSPHVTLSIGVASQLPSRDAAWQDIELIAAAERGLAQAIDAGRNIVMLESSATTAPAP
jgi:diguanylate cyclase (GGDEF)-like protein